jgi:hypothetical protein
MPEDFNPMKLTEERWKAGEEYLSSLQKLGLDPECLFWSFDEVVGYHVLVLATSTYELAGPTAIARTLFQAYKASATPRTLNPFLVRIHSLDHTFIQETAANRELYDGLNDPANNFVIGREGMRWHKDWFYKFSIQKKGRLYIERHWTTYRRNVEKLAA